MLLLSKQLALQDCIKIWTYHIPGNLYIGKQYIIFHKNDKLLMSYFLNLYNYLYTTNFLFIGTHMKKIYPKRWGVNKSIQGTQEEQMFYNRKTLQEITEMRHENPLNNEV